MRSPGRPPKLKLWQAILLLAFLLAFGIWQFFDLAEFERTGGVKMVHKLTALLYRAGGKWTVLGFDLLVAGVLGYAIVLAVRQSRQVDALRARMAEEETARRAAAPTVAAAVGAAEAAAAPAPAPSEPRAAPRWQPPPAPSSVDRQEPRREAAEEILDPAQQPRFLR